MQKHRGDRIRENRNVSVTQASQCHRRIGNPFWQAILSQGTNCNKFFEVDALAASTDHDLTSLMRISIALM